MRHFTKNRSAFADHLVRISESYCFFKVKHVLSMVAGVGLLAAIEVSARLVEEADDRLRNVICSSRKGIGGCKFFHFIAVHNVATRRKLVKKIIFALWLSVIALAFAMQAQAACTPTGFVRDSINMTAALINPSGAVSGVVNATGCNVAVYFDAGHSGIVKNAEIYGANYFGVLVNGDAGSVNVDVLNSTIRNIGESPLNGTQHGVGIYYRGFFPVSAVSGKIDGNYIYGYQKGGIVVNGQGVQAMVTNNRVEGEGHINFIAQNGIQVGYGATASVMRNSVSDNSYIGFPGDGSASGGILIVGGPGYGTCPDGNACPLTVNAKANNNVLRENDVGVYLSKLEADFSAPLDMTNIKVVDNTISSDQCFNGSYQAAISDVGNNDKLINNDISGPGYASSCTTVYNPLGNAIDADATFTNKAKIHANSSE